MITGYVTRWLEDKGYGFAVCGDATHLVHERQFIHYELVDDELIPKQDTPVRLSPPTRVTVTLKDGKVVSWWLTDVRAKLEASLASRPMLYLVRQSISDSSPKANNEKKCFTFTRTTMWHVVACGQSRMTLEAQASMMHGIWKIVSGMDEVQSSIVEMHQ